MSETSPLYRLLGVALGADPKGWALARREAGASYRDIARELSERAGHTVSHETIRRWFESQVGAA